jgi:hypothetical protein
VDVESQRAAETAWTYLAFDSVSPSWGNSRSTCTSLDVPRV